MARLMNGRAQAWATSGEPAPPRLSPGLFPGLAAGR
jgi:hypothetical protein